MIVQTYLTAIPVMLSSIQPDRMQDLVNDLHAMGAQQIFLALNDFEQMDEDCQKLASVLPRFRDAQLEPVIWVGSSIYHASYPGRGFRKMVGIDGSPAEALTCPTDENFVRYYCEQIRRLSQLPVDTIFLDDDFRMNFINRTPVCFCDAHMKLYQEALGRAISREEMCSRLLAEDDPAVLRAWLEVNGGLLRSFAEAIRRAAAPRVRMALCSAPALWGADGTSAIELTHILAGSHPPVLRLSGSPSWVGWDSFRDLGHNLGNMIDFSRMQAAACLKEQIATLGEGDTYPRPRYTVSAALLENFDLALRADGAFAGILKYVYDYISLPYERGYVERAMKNRPLYEAVERMFGGKTTTGVAAYVPPARDLAMATTALPLRENRVATLPAIRFLNDNSLSTAFGAEEPCVVFGDSGKVVPLERLNHGAILDAVAAQHLRARGVDVGILESRGLVRPPEKTGPLTHNLSGEEYFLEDVPAPLVDPQIHDLSPDPSAQILSQIRIGPRRYPGTYLYQNRDGLRLCIFAFDAGRCPPESGLFRNYGRQRQLVDRIFPWLTGKRLDAVCLGHPDLYLLTKKSDDALTVGLWNFSPDRIDAPLVRLGEVYRHLETVQCQGALRGDQVCLSTLYPQEFACFTVRK